MEDVHDAVMQGVGWLAYPVIVPVPALALAMAAAVVAVLGSRRYCRDPHPAPLGVQPWLWGSLTVVALLAYLTLGWIPYSWRVSALLALWLTLPSLAVVRATVRARRCRRRWLRVLEGRPAA